MLLMVFSMDTEKEERRVETMVKTVGWLICFCGEEEDLERLD